MRIDYVIGPCYVRRCLVAFIIALAITVDLRAQMPAPAGAIAFVNVAVVPMDRERVLANQTVVVEGGRVIALGPTGRIKVPTGAVQIDGTGKYLIPGLADMHVHLTRDAHQFNQRMISYLTTGVTTVRNMDHADPNSDTVVWLRNQVATGKMLGPRIYTSGSLGLNGGPVSAIASQVEQYKARGYDFIKVYSWDAGKVFDSIATAARRVGIPIAGHLPGGVSLRQALAAGMRSFEHNLGYYAFDSNWEFAPKVDSGVTLEMLAAETQRAGSWNCPTAFWTYPDRVKAVRALHAAGAGLLLGTDTPQPEGVPGFLAGFVEVGLTPYQALLTATRNVAEFFGTVEDAGTIAVGKRADLVLLHGNPLEDVWHTTYPAGVMAAGRWLSREELDRLWTAAHGQRQGPPYLYYWRSLAMDASVFLIRRAGLSDKVRVIGEDERIRVADSLGYDARGKAAHQRLFELLAQQLGETRATLTAADQVAFDREARGWLAKRERESFRVAISGVQR